MFIQAYRKRFKVVKMCKVLKVSTSGFYAWIRKKESKRYQENQALLKEIIAIHQKSNRVYGSIKVLKALKRTETYKNVALNQKRVERLMKENNLHSKTVKKYKATTDSHHNLPVAENLLNRNFQAERPNEKLVSDITYVRTDEGWLYVAAINDLFGDYNVGLAMSTRMSKDLAIRALKDAYRRGGKPQDTTLHSDRGSQYCSKEYQKLLNAYGYRCSMSRKGNCWDNAPMESFWGKMKMEWLNEVHFKTIEEAKKMVFEYILIFHNRQRLHAAFGYQTPYEVYQAKISSKLVS